MFERMLITWTEKRKIGARVEFTIKKISGRKGKKEKKVKEPVQKKDKSMITLLFIYYKSK